MKTIPLTQNRFALVDDADFERVSRWKWCASKCKKTWYALRRKRGGGTVKLHRFIMRPPKGKEVDHKDGDGLNNQRGNLTVCTHAENMANRVHLNTNNTSGVTGVCWSKREKKWVVRVIRKGKLVYAQLFESKDEAISARRQYCG